MQLHEQYRPSTWDDVVGQDKPLARINALRKRGLSGRALGPVVLPLVVTIVPPWIQVCPLFLDGRMWNMFALLTNTASWPCTTRLGIFASAINLS